MTTVVIPAYTIPARSISVTIPAVTIPAQTITLPDPPVVVTPPPVVIPPSVGDVLVAVGDSVATIQSKMNSVAAGGRLVFPAGSFAFGGTSIRGKSNTTIYAAGLCMITGPGTDTKGAFDISGLTGAVVRGQDTGQGANQGFVFNGTCVNADNSVNCSVGRNRFQNTKSTGSQNGTAVSTNGATGLLVINNDVQDCDGCIFGGENWDGVVFDGNGVDGGAGQAFSIQQPNDTTRGRNITIQRNAFSNWGRGVIETGGTVDGTNDSPGQSFTNFAVLNNWFVGYGNSRTSADNVNDVGPVSIVCRNQTGTKVQGNYIEKGTFDLAAAEAPRGGGGYTEGVEVNSEDGACVTSGNTLVNIDGPFPTYGTVGQTLSNNVVFGAQSGNTTTTQPVRPAKPARVAW